MPKRDYSTKEEDIIWRLKKLGWTKREIKPVLSALYHLSTKGRLGKLINISEDKEKVTLYTHLGVFIVDRKQEETK